MVPIIWCSICTIYTDLGHSLISAFVIPFLESISELATDKVSIIYLVSVAKETKLSLPLSEFPKTGFVASMPNMQHAQLISEARCHMGESSKFPKS